MNRTLMWSGLGAGVVLASALLGVASSHREAPLISADPLADNTDVYAFVSPDATDTVTLIADWIPLEAPNGGPNFYKFGDDVLYRINIDNDGDADDDIVYEFRFTTTTLNSHTFLYNTGPITSLDDPAFNVRQTYSLTRIDRFGRHVLGRDLATPPVNVGARSTPSYDALAAAAVHALPDGSRVFAGQRDDPFFVDLGSVFDLLGLRPFNAAHKIPMANAPGVDGLRGVNTHTVALQVPKRLLTHDGSLATDANNTNSIIGVYSTTLRRHLRLDDDRDDHHGRDGDDDRHDWVQVSRLGMPLVNEVIIPLARKDRFNASDPKNDAQFASFVTSPEPAGLIAALYPGVTVPPSPRNDLVAIFLTGIAGLNQPAHVKASEMIRLNMAIPPSVAPNRLGLLAGQLDGFPNGRRLGDDVVDIELRALSGGTPFTPSFNHAPNNVLGDGVDSNDKPFLPNFPYVASPFPGYEP
ncbi:MAG TPA: DUF4331 domain-containing protein [Vicinamibacterales bacterium]|nr:DUF4331 domain-containing protein [Vicinamibacterales bacterium]